MSIEVEDTTNVLTPLLEHLHAELAKYKGIDSEWLKAYRKLHNATTDAEEAAAYAELDALRTGYSWTEMSSEPMLKLVVEQRDRAESKVKSLEEGIKALCLLWTNDVPNDELLKLLKQGKNL